MKSSNLLKLSSYLRGKFDNMYYSEEEIAGFLYGLRYNRQLTNNDIKMMLKYIMPEIYVKDYYNYTYPNESPILSKIKKSLAKINLRYQSRGW